MPQLGSLLLPVRLRPRNRFATGSPSTTRKRKKLKTTTKASVASAPQHLAARRSGALTSPTPLSRPATASRHVALLALVGATAAVASTTPTSHDPTTRRRRRCATIAGRRRAPPPPSPDERDRRQVRVGRRRVREEHRARSSAGCRSQPSKRSVRYACRSGVVARSRCRRRSRRTRVSIRCTISTPLRVVELDVLRLVVRVVGRVAPVGVVVVVRRIRRDPATSWSH